MKKVIGIDPGKGGGIAVVDAESHSVVEVCPMPDTLYDISEFIERHRDCVSCYIESVHSMPGQGVASTFTFGQYFGYVQMAVVCHKVRSVEVIPSKWQQLLGMKSKKGEAKVSHKNRLKGRAQQLFPHAKVTLKTADALLIAEYGCLLEGKK